MELTNDPAVRPCGIFDCGTRTDREVSSSESPWRTPATRCLGNPFSIGSWGLPSNGGQASPREMIGITIDNIPPILKTINFLQEQN